MSILVNKNITYNIYINGYFKSDENNNIIGFKQGIGDVEIKCIVSNRDFESMSKIIEECSIINSVTGKPLLRSGLLSKLILLNYFKEIQVSSPSDNYTIKINKDTINDLHYDLVKCLATKWLDFTDGA